MGTNRFRRLPITKIGKIYGILTITDLLRAIVDNGFPDAYKVTIQDYMTPDPKTINLEKTVADAAKIMAAGDFGSLIVVGDIEDRIQGIITERDILRAATNHDWKGQTVGDIPPDLLESKTLALPSSTPLFEAIKKMVEKKVHRLVTLAEDGSVEGMMSANDVTNLVAKEREEIKSNPNFLDSLTVKYLATSPVVSVDSSVPIPDALKTMAEQSMGGLPIVDDGKLKGIFTERVVVHTLAKL